MIVRLDREQQKKARRQLLTDVVYITCSSVGLYRHLLSTNYVPNPILTPLGGLYYLIFRITLWERQKSKER
jgi:hypothetical protein